MAHPAFGSAMSLICLVIFASVRYVRVILLKKDKNSKIKDIIWFTMIGLSIIDYIVRLIFYKKAWIADILRPFIIILMFQSQQDFYWMLLC